MVLLGTTVSKSWATLYIVAMKLEWAVQSLAPILYQYSWCFLVQAGRLGGWCNLILGTTNMTTFPVQQTPVMINEFSYPRGICHTYHFLEHSWIGSAFQHFSEWSMVVNGLINESRKYH